MVRPRRGGEGLETTLEVGKAGLTKTVLGELRAQLEARGTVKVRFRKGAIAETDRKALAAGLAQAAGAVLVEVRGLTAIYRSPREAQRAA